MRKDASALYLNSFGLEAQLHLGNNEVNEELPLFLLLSRLCCYTHMRSIRTAVVYRLLLGIFTAITGGLPPYISTLLVWSLGTFQTRLNDRLVFRVPGVQSELGRAAFPMMLMYL